MRVKSFATAMLMLAAASLAAGGAPVRKTQNVVVIVSDGLRWQEVFGGADPAFATEENGVEDIAAFRREFWRETAEARRAAVLPFFWTVVANQGQLYGDRRSGSPARDVNGLDFSYPGYNEILTGAADPRLNTNDPVPNPNVSVFEWLNGMPEFRGRVAAFTTWSVFPAIFNTKRSGLPVWGGWDPERIGRQPDSLNRLLATTTRLWADNVWDSFMQIALVEYLKDKKPRVLFVGYGETDEWAHSRRYDLYLASARQVDRFIAELWETMQAMPEYRDSTTFIVTTDHGRGRTPRDWKDHDREVPGSDEIWIAVLGPDTPPLGHRRNAAPVTQSQIAATVAALLGRDYRADVPKAAQPLTDAIRLGSAR